MKSKTPISFETDVGFEEGAAATFKIFLEQEKGLAPLMRGSSMAERIWDRELIADDDENNDDDDNEDAPLRHRSADEVYDFEILIPREYVFSIERR